MKIAVYGATGQVGTRIVAEATARGHQVTALSRRQPTTPLPAGATWRKADATSNAEVKQIAAENDVVVASHGPSREPGGNPSAFTGEFADFAAAVGTVGGTRLFVIGGAGSLLAAPGVRLVDTPEFPAEYKAEALAHAAALDGLKADGPASWTYLSPAPVIAPGERTGSYVTGTESPVGSTISLEDLAVAVVDELETPAYVNTRFTVAAS